MTSKLMSWWRRAATAFALVALTLTSIALTAIPAQAAHDAPAAIVSGDIAQGFTERGSVHGPSTSTATAQSEPSEPADVAYIYVWRLPILTSYMVGESLYLEGMKIMAVWTDGTTRVLTEGEFTVTGFDSSAPGDVMLTMTYVADPSITTTLEIAVFAERDEEPFVVPYKDVAPGQTQFFTQIMWLSNEDISRGWITADGFEFRPYQNINRDAMAAFLYRYAGSPRVKVPDQSPFVDVPVSSPFYAELLWMDQSGISTGWSTSRGKEFRPHEPITRDAMAAFLYRFAGRPSYTAPSASPFSDISTDKQFYREIAWMNEVGISTGWTGGAGKPEFRPYAHTKRDAMAAFLYRYDRLVGN